MVLSSMGTRICVVSNGEDANLLEVILLGVMERDGVGNPNDDVGDMAAAVSTRLWCGGGGDCKVDIFKSQSEKKNAQNITICTNLKKKQMGPLQ